MTKSWQLLAAVFPPFAMLSNMKIKVMPPIAAGYFCLQLLKHMVQGTRGSGALQHPTLHGEREEGGGGHGAWEMGVGVPKTFV